MSSEKPTCSTTIGRKVMMSITGLLLVGFLVGHLLGNFSLYAGDEGTKFNQYAYFLTTTLRPWIYLAEVGLLVLFLSHMAMAFKLTSISKKARPDAYAVRNNLGKSTLYSRTMLHTGIIIFIFLVLHLITFKFGTEYTDIVAGTPMRNLYLTVVELFANKVYSAVYIVCMILMGFHLRHGIKSALQTFGVNHPKLNCKIDAIAIVLALVFAIGYCSFPVYFGFIKPENIDALKAALKGGN